MTDHAVTIFVGVLGLIGIYLSHRLTMRHARNQKCWELEIEDAQKIEKLAGQIAEQLGSPNLSEERLKLAMRRMGEYILTMGVFGKYKKMNQNMRNFQNAANRVVNSFHHSQKEQMQSDQNDLRTTFDALSLSCELIKKGKGK